MAASDLNVLDRQRSRVKWQQQQQSSYSYFNSSYAEEGILSLPVTQLGDNSPPLQAISSYVDDEKSDKNPRRDHSNEILGYLGTGWPDLAIGGCPPLATECPGPGIDRFRTGRVSSPLSNKRKAEEAQGGKVGADATEDNARKKKTKEDPEELAAAVEPNGEIPQPSNDNTDKGSRENSKESAPPSQKPDYIHVRARRGQATDSHSLAERVRREKISERMKYLQDLVPGCNKITGKAGMLDEIINYVQSLQRQVEFLSMKLAAVNPRLDFNIDHFFSKEINTACSPSFPTDRMPSEAVDPSYLQFNPVLDMAMNPSELALRRTTNAPVPVPDALMDSCFSVHGSSFPWDADMQSLYNAELHQGRGFTFPFQLFQGNIIPSNPKMEL